MLSIKPTYTDQALSTKATSNSSIIHTQFPKVKESILLKYMINGVKKQKEMVACL